MEEDIFPSPLKMAQRLTKVIVTQIEFASVTKYSYRTNFINGTHEPVLASFIYYALNDFDHTADDPQFIKKFDGTIGFAEGFDIEVYQSEKK